ncbi:MAG: type II toxin-antitoxin system Phd/YefM family antitoxin [Candidatus Omnitrophica bacterium]|nr:type II toxin-antitoxin system Phd/YefM family antitoxin [Candidatus Omnitrophota bacterium]
MRFVSVRDLRGKSAQIWKRLAQLKEMVITSNGKPIAIISATSEDTLEESLSAIRAARAMAAVEAMQLKSVETEKDRISLEEINTEIQAERKARSK